MNKIKPTIFKITKEEIQEIVKDMIRERTLRKDIKLSDEQIIKILEYVECDEFLAKDIRMSIKDSIIEVINTDC